MLFNKLLLFVLLSMFLSMFMSVAALADEAKCTTLVDSDGEYAASFCSGGAKHLDEDEIDALANTEQKIAIDTTWVE